MVTLDVSTRDKKTSAKAVRAQGFIPAVFYGKKEPSTPISIKAADFTKVLEEAGESTVVVLNVAGGKKVEALIHDIEFDPLNEQPVHVDFYAFEKGKKIEVPVELEFTGIAPAVRDLGGILVKVLHELNIEAQPANLPHSIIVDVSSLVTLESVIKAKDLALPEGVALIDDPEEIVASISVAKEEPEEPAAPVDLSQIEVEKKGKEEEASEEAGAESAESDTKDSKK